MKMFFTQLQGVTDSLFDQEDRLEDAARLIAMSIVSDGTVYWYGEGEMDGIVTLALTGKDGVKDSKRWSEATAVSPLDTVIVCSEWRNSASAMNVVSSAAEKGATVIGLTSLVAPGHDDPDWTSTAEVLLTNGISQGLIPGALDEPDSRIGTPHLLAGLHLYYTFYFILLEMLEDQV
ncbi:DUF2529 family protein [Salisediminibacterium beveridgei]|uniref:DUF2529 domain-containing protein n=1 Tax=Salisediminibacterium beveridgei TaxID=632773 RepID=A0A1D7QRB9_9BACI|nr:DUF2529 family protein [Salisediminibacterium beveridgei]AOM81553.1 hypothetical protein BBEV_0158 [Salisediminibacterium beveridgei]